MSNKVYKVPVFLTIYKEVEIEADSKENAIIKVGQMSFYLEDKEADLTIDDELFFSDDY